MDKYEQRAVLGGSFLMLVFFVAVVIATTGFGVTVPTCIVDVKPFKHGQLLKLADKHYELHAVAKMWSFDPPEVTIPPGSRLDIFLTSPDVAHGFNIEKTNINLMAIPGQVTYASVTFDQNEWGNFRLFCHEYCGMNHHAMQGWIKVWPAAALGATNQPAPVAAQQPTPAPASAENPADTTTQQPNGGAQQ